MSSRRVSSAVVAGVAAAVAVAACGGQQQSASEPSGKFQVEVQSASFPTSQILTQHTHLVIRVHNPGPKAIPNPAVTICNVSCWPVGRQQYPLPAGEGTSVLPFAVRNRTPDSASPSKPAWVVDRNPNETTPCVTSTPNNGTYSCASGGEGGMATSDANTWALGHPLKPGRTVTFDWTVTAVCAGRFTVAWEVAAGLWGGAKAVPADGSALRGTFTVTITGQPQQSYVDNSGRIVSQSGPAPAPNGQSAPETTQVPCTAGGTGGGASGG